MFHGFSVHAESFVEDSASVQAFTMATRRTSQVLKVWLLEGARPTPGALADYGFDPVVYQMSNEDLPGEADLTALKLRYIEILSEGEDKELELHWAVKNKKLHELLGPSFSWVRSISC